jgi:L-arabinokinase
MSTVRWQGEAPGRLDVLGGVADYSGSLVLQMPIRATTRVTIVPLDSPCLEVASEQAGEVTLPLPAAALTAPAVPIGVLRGWLEENRAPHWARYSLGCFLLFCQAHEWRPPGGTRFAVTSDVPISMGVSSSAALEVATLRALEAASGQQFRGTGLARLAQRAENELVGAPCGLMDQLASAHGTAGALLPILCRPDVLDDPVPLPAGAMVVGWPSGVRHAVAGSPYATARAAAFMGKKVLEQSLPGPLAHVTELSPSQLDDLAHPDLSPVLLGRDFLARHGAVDDPLSKIDPDACYPVDAAVRFPILENFRAAQAVRLLRAVHSDNRQETLRKVGELLYQSHSGYSAMGLGCPETDVLVQAVRDLGPERGLYGARVSGGGSGGTVVVLLEAAALPELERLAASGTFGDGSPTRLIA